LKPPWPPAASHWTDQGGSRFLRHRLLVLLERPQHRRCGLLDAIAGRLDASGRFVTATSPVGDVPEGVVARVEPEGLADDVGGGLGFKLSETPILEVLVEDRGSSLAGHHD
jgi:hypothetical protein